MNREEAIKWLELLRKLPVSWDDYSEKTANIRRAAEQKEREAIDMAIEELSRSKGEWIHIKDCLYVCSECGQQVVGDVDQECCPVWIDWKFCNNCGAKMVDKR